MIDVEEFLAAHPVESDGGDVRTRREEHSGAAQRNVDSVIAVPHGRSREHGRKASLVPTHEVSVVSPYTSGFGGSIDEGEMGENRRGVRSRGRKTGKFHQRRYRTGDAVKRVPDDPHDFDACREAALNLLDAAPRPAVGLSKKLIAKGYDEDVCADVVARLVQVHLVDDESYAQSAIRSCLARQLGMRGTLMELRRKDVDAEVAAEQVRDAQEQGMFEDAAWELGRKIAHKTEGLDSQVRKRRFWSAGGRKGHDPETLRRVARELLG